MNCPGEAARRISIARAPEGWVCSTMTTASAPRGSGPPVAMEVAVPDMTGRDGAVPQAITSSLSLTRTGVASPAPARSAERTAKPSTLERSNGGTSIGATTSCARVQPSASESSRDSDATGARKQRRLEPLQRLLARQDGQELVLIHRVTVFRQRRAGHVGTLKTDISPAAYRHRPAFPPRSPRPRRTRRARRRRGRWHRARGRRPPAASIGLRSARAARFR